MAFPRLGRRRGAYHEDVNARGRRSGPHAAALRLEGATQRRRTCQGDGGEDLGAVAWTARRGATARRGDAAATCRSGQPRGRPRGGGGDRVPWRDGSKERRSGSARVDAAAVRTTRRRRCGPTGRHSGSPFARSANRRTLGDGLHGNLRRRTQTTVRVGRAAWMERITGGRVINPIAREVDDAPLGVRTTTRGWVVEAERLTQR